ncbi:MAG: hypothetical protein ACRDGA_07865 [Bacteroidota bacterium]
MGFRRNQKDNDAVDLNAVVQELIDRIDDLEQEISDVRDTADSAQYDAERVASDLNDLEYRVEDIDSFEVREVVSDLEDEVSNLRDEVDTLKAESD